MIDSDKHLNLLRYELITAITIFIVQAAAVSFAL